MKAQLQMDTVSPSQHVEAAKTSYILIDYENVQPRDLDLVPPTGWQVKIFLGPKQYAKHASLNAAQRLGSICEYINVLKPGRNALDFHIAYYLGVLSRTHADFYIIAEDTGYDPLLEQLRIGNVVALRVASVAKIPALTPETIKPPRLVKPPQPTTQALASADLVQRSITHLQQISQNRPKTLSKLSGYLTKHLKIEPAETALVIGKLREIDIVVINEGGEIIYQVEKFLFPAKAA